MRVSVWNARELQGFILAMKGLDREITKEIRTQIRKITTPEWQKELAERAATRLQHAVLVRTARVQVSDQNVQLRSAHIGRSLAGGWLPSEAYAPVEFGADREKTSTYWARSKKGTAYEVKNRHTRRGLPPVKRPGNVVYPGAAAMIPRIAALMVQTLVRTVHEQIERS